MGSSDVVVEILILFHVLYETSVFDYSSLASVSGFGGIPEVVKHFGKD